MLKIKKFIIVSLFIFVVPVFAGCVNNGNIKDGAPVKGEAEELGSDEYRIYYISSDETKLEYYVYNAVSRLEETGETEVTESAAAVARELLSKMSFTAQNSELNNTENSEKFCVIKSPVKVVDILINADRIYVYFNAAYYGMDSVNEILVRAAVVRTLTQIRGIDRVMFYVDGKPQENKNGIMIGSMTAEEFIDNAGGSIKSYIKVDITLYFANADGTRLCPEKREVFVNEINTVEKVVLEQLLKGPENKEFKKVLPDGVTIISVITKEGVCYVNLDDTFLTGSINVVETVPVYAIVNSLTEIPNIDKVQILIRGEVGKVYRQAIHFNAPLEAREDLIEY